MSIRKFTLGVYLAFSLSAFGTFNAQADSKASVETESATLSVRLNILDACTINAKSNISFDPINTRKTPKQRKEGAFSIECTASHPVKFKLLNTAENNDFQLTGLTNSKGISLAYHLFSDANYQNLETGQERVVILDQNHEATVPIYAQLVEDQELVDVGEYSDTIRAEISWN